MTCQYFIGIDVSKATLDCTVLKKGTFLLNETIDNELPSIRAWIKKISGEFKAGGAGTLYCLENTGTYKEPLLQVLKKKRGIQLCIESAMRIKKSMGLQRGKSDKIDSQRIAHYAYQFQSKLLLHREPRPLLQNLKRLNSLKRRLENNIMQLKNHITVKEPYLEKKRKDSLDKRCKASLAALKGDVKGIEKEVYALVMDDPRLNRLYKILISVPGVGKVVAIELMIATNEFLNFANWKKFACYGGTAPFEHTSGTSVQGKTRVSKIANRHIKSIMHLPALSCVRAKGELRTYFLRKVKEGHSKMSVINAVKNKIFMRVFSCVQGDRLYTRKIPAKRPEK